MALSSGSSAECTADILTELQAGLTPTGAKGINKGVWFQDCVLAMFRADAQCLTEFHRELSEACVSEARSGLQGLSWKSLVCFNAGTMCLFHFGARNLSFLLIYERNAPV